MPEGPLGRITVTTADGAELRVWEHPAHDTPHRMLPTVVLAHGWTLTHQSWLPVVEQLQGLRAVRVVLYDQRGHGASTLGRGTASIRDLAHDLAAVIDAMVPDGRLVLGGHSMGGMAVMAYAGTHADQLRDRVGGVALVATSSGDLGKPLPSLTEVALRIASRGPRIPAGLAARAGTPRSLLFGDAPHPAHVKAVRDQIAGTHIPTFGKFYAAFNDHDETEALAHLDGIPTTVLVGERDRLTSVRHSRRIAELAPHSSLRVLAGRGHMLAYEATAEVVSALVELVDGAASQTQPD
jgi:pimeloyl-ACP methyl ester carboxylesterase